MPSGSLLRSNPLIQRVRRHSAMATLYRTAEVVTSEATGIPAAQTPAPPGTPLVVATLAPPASGLLGATEGVPEMSQPGLPPAAPSTPPAATQAVQRQPATSTTAPQQASPPSGEKSPATGTASPAQAPDETPAEGSSLEWMGDDEWKGLKSFMEGHQRKLASEKSAQGTADTQLAPDEQARQEPKDRAATEASRRQELARAGKLPRAKVVYVSDEETGERTRLPEPAQPATTPVQRSEQQPDEPVDSAPDEGPAQLSDESQEGDAGSEQIEPAPEQSTLTPVRSESPPPPAPAPSQKIQRQAGEEAPSPKPSGQMEQVQPAGEPPSPEGAVVAESAPEASESVQQTTPGSVPIQREPVSDLPPDAPQGESPAPETAPVAEQKPGLGRRLLDAARTFLRGEATDQEMTAAPHGPAEATTASVTGPTIQREPAPDEAEGQITTLPAGRQPEAGVVELRPGSQPETEAVPESHTQPETHTQTETQSGRRQDLEAGEPVPAAGPSPAAGGETVARQVDGIGAERDSEPVVSGEISEESVARKSEPAPASPEKVDFGQPEPAVDDGEGPIARTLSLEDVWPVDKLEAPQDGPLSPGRPAETSAPGPTIQRKPAGGDTVSDEVSDEVHSALKDVAPARPTDSSIELVTPRRPRPTPPPASGEVSPAIHRKPSESRQPVLPDLPSQPEETASVPKREDPWMVPTEVGDLPSDLWRLMGDTPPARVSRTPPATVQAEPAAVPGLEQTAAPLAIAEAIPEPPKPLFTQEFPSIAVQRAISVDEVLSEVEPESGPEEEGGESDIDISELARRVLPEIKRRLNMEWERGRGRI